MKLRLELLHEGDLFRFFQALAAQKVGRFTVNECKLQRLPVESRGAGQSADAQSRVRSRVDHDRRPRDRRRQSHESAAALCALIVLAAPAFAQDAPLGRLFLTPEQRAALDNARRNKIRAEAVAAAVVKTAQAPRGPERDDQRRGQAQRR